MLLKITISASTEKIVSCYATHLLFPTKIACLKTYRFSFLSTWSSFSFLFFCTYNSQLFILCQTQLVGLWYLNFQIMVASYRLTCAANYGIQIYMFPSSLNTSLASPQASYIHIFWYFIFCFNCLLFYHLLRIVFMHCFHACFTPS